MLERLAFRNGRCASDLASADAVVAVGEVGAVSLRFAAFSAASFSASFSSAAAGTSVIELGVFGGSRIGVFAGALALVSSRRVAAGAFLVVVDLALFLSSEVYGFGEGWLMKCGCISGLNLGTTLRILLISSYASSCDVNLGLNGYSMSH